MTWNKKRLGDFAPFNYGKGLPKEKRISGDVLVYGSNGIVGSHNQSLLSEPVVVIGRKGSVGEVHLTSGPSWPIDTTFYAEDSDEVDLDFLFYLLQTLPLKTNSDSAVPGLSRDYAHSLEVRVPNVVMQTAIGKVLKSIDFKITNNSALSKTLEQIARTIFKSWFIDFDPVKAKMAGEKPAGMDNATAALFPDSMEDSELGAIPSGWSVGALGHHLIVSKGKSYKSSELVDSDTALVTLKSFLRGGGYRHNGLKSFSGEYKPEQIIEPGELIVSYTDVTQAADVIGKPALVMPDPKFSKLVASLDIGIVRPRSKAVGKSFLYQLFLTPRFKHHIDGYTNGTTVLHLGKGALEEFKAVLPSQELMRQYENLVGIFSRQAQLLSLENFGLTTLRDSLLPRLISGELQIPEEMLVS